MRDRLHLSELFSVRPGEGTRVAWLLVYSAGSGIFLAFFFSAANALFLKHFDAAMLPWTYVGSALVGYGVTDAVVRLQKKLPFRRLLSSMLLVLAVVTAVLWSAHLVWKGDRWVSFVTFLAANSCFMVLNVGFWGLATRLFDLRQGKRLFGLVTAGEVLVSIAGFFLVPALIPVLGETAHLLLFSIAGAVVSFLAATAIGRRFRDETSTMSAGGDEPAAGDGFRKDKYFLTMGALVAAFTFTFFLVDLGFLTEVKASHSAGGEVASGDLAAFFGLYYGSIRVLELLFKLFFTGRSINVLGLRLSLLLLPAGLFAVVGLACVSELLSRAGGFGWAHASFFYLVLFGKLVWVVLRKALYDAAFGVLYQPLPAERRLLFQARMGSFSQVSTLAIGVVLVAASQAGVDAFYVFCFLLLVLAGWIVAVTRMHREYRSRLMENLSDAVGSGAGVSPAEVIVERILSGPPEDLRYFLNMLEGVDPTAVDRVLAEKLEDPLPQVRQGVLERIGDRRALGVIDAVEKCARAERSRLAAEAARDTLAALTELRALAHDPDRRAALGRSEDPAKRELAAVALGWCGASEGVDELSELISDHNRQVRRAAIVAAGRMRHPRFWPQIVGYLGSAELRDAASHALITIGETALPEMELAFRRLDQDLEVKLRLLNVYERIGGRRVRLLLRDKLRDPDKAVRERTLRILSAAPLEEDDDQERRRAFREIEKTVGAVVWNTAALLDLGEDAAVAEVRDALECELQQNRGAIFLLLALLYDPNAVKLVRENIEDQAEEGTVYALEMLEILISAELKPLVFPVLEDLAHAQLLRQIGRYYPRLRLPPIERLNAIIHREGARMGTWTKACAIQALGRLSTAVPDMLVANLFHPEPLLQELAAQNIFKLSPEDFARHVAKLSYEARERVERVSHNGSGEKGGEGATSLYAKVSLLSGARGFGGLSWSVLTRMASLAEDIVCRPADVVPAADDPEGTLYVVARGLLATEDGVRGVLGKSTVVAARAFTGRAHVLEPTRLLRLDGEALVHLASDHVELVPAILRAGSRPRIGALSSLSMISSHHSTIISPQSF